MSDVASAGCINNILPLLLAGATIAVAACSNLSSVHLND